VPKPDDAILAVTHRCNAHCVMCNVWRSAAADALMPEHLRKLPEGLRTVNLTGGEPFLRKDLPAFVRELRARCRRATIAVSTNGYLPDRIEQVMDEILAIDPTVRLALSLDGIGAAHDRVRGDAGAFDKAVTLIDRMQARGYGGLRLSMTLGATNLDQFDAVASFAAERGLELGVVAAHAARTQLCTDSQPAPRIPPSLREEFARWIGRWLRSWRARQWLRAHFACGTWRYLIGRPWRVPCRAAQAYFFLQADGTVYSDTVDGVAMGSLLTDSWADIWTGPAAERARAAARRRQEPEWMICTARSAYRCRPLRVIGWVLLRKLLAHLRCVPLPPPPQRDREPGVAHPAR